jgi:hypothetical protein
VLKSNASKLQIVLMCVALAIAFGLHFTGLREWAQWLAICIVAVGVLLR